MQRERPGRPKQATVPVNSEDTSWYQYEAPDSHPMYRCDRALAEQEAARYYYNPPTQERPINLGDFPVPERPSEIPLAGADGVLTTFELNNDEMAEKERQEEDEEDDEEERYPLEIGPGDGLSQGPGHPPMAEIPYLTQPSQLSQERATRQDDSRHGEAEAGAEATGPFEKFYRDNGNNKAVLLCGAYGLKHDGRDLGDWQEEPYASMKQRNASIPKVKQHMRVELKRRFTAMGWSKKQSKCSSFSAQLCRERMMQYPITDPRDIAFIQKEEGRYYKLILNGKKQREEAARVRLAESNWHGNLPHLRLYFCICHPRARIALVNSRKVLDRPELDAGQDHDDAPETFEEALADVYNDSTITFSTERLPNLHDDFRESIELKLEDMPGGQLTPDEAGRRYAQARGMLIKVIAYSFVLLYLWIGLALKRLNPDQ